MKYSGMAPLMALVCTPLLHGQFGRGGAEWVTNGSDAQRSFSIPADAKISKDGLQKPGFQYLWKVKFNNESIQLNSLTPAVLIDRYIGYRGFRSLAFMAGSSNTVFAVDTDLSRIEWQAKLPASAPGTGSLVCPAGLTANIARDTTAAYPIPAAGGAGLGGRSGPAGSAVGELGQGAVTVAPSFAAAAAALLPGAPPPRPPGLRIPGLIYVLAGDGILHTLYISNGTQAKPPLKFLPPNANAQGLIVLDGIAYAATRDCNGNPSGVWSLDLASQEVASWKPTKGVIAGSGGPAFGPDGTVYVATSAGELMALETKSLKVKDTYSTGGQEFTSSAMVFPYGDKDLIAAATKDGRIHVLDGKSLGGSDHQTPLYKTQPYSAGAFVPGALATSRGPDGVRWVLAAAGVPAPGSGFSPANGNITDGTMAAWKMVERNGTLSLEPGWTSRNLTSPLPPMIINGVVFAVASGEYRGADNTLSAAQRAQRSSPAVLYALDGNTGKALWDSGKTITSFVHSGGLSGGAGQLYLQTYDQTLYTFGFPMEH